MVWEVLNRCVLSCDLKWGNESMFMSWGGNEFQRRAEGTDRCMKEEDLREREGVGTWRRSDRYGGANLLMALNVNRRTLN